MDEKLKNNENEAQIIKHEDLARHNSRGIYMRDDHCDWGSLNITGANNECRKDFL